MNRIRLFFPILLCLWFFTPAIAGQVPLLSQPLKAEQAFMLNASAQEDQLIFEWTIAPGTYLYQKAFKFNTADAQLGEPLMPASTSIEDPFYGKTAIYRNQVSITVPVLAMQQHHLQINVAYQGCSDLGFCYPPQTQDLTIEMPKLSSAPQDSAMSLLQNKHKSIALLSFFGFGLLLAFTPCVLPMIPILSALIIDEQRQHHRLHAFKMALTYVLAMACTYAGLGAVVAQLGALVQAQLQSPLVLGFTAGVLVFMAFWLIYDHRFTVFTLGNHPLHKISQALPRGEFIGVALMGVIASLVVSPCVTAPLVGALSYIALSGNVFLGSAALFCLALGMGVPLIAVTWGGTALLPKRGPWMHAIKWTFSAILIIMAFSLIARFIPNPFATDTESKLAFTQIHNPAELTLALAESKAAHQPVMLDFYADWCRACVVMEHTVFQDEQVLSLLSKVKLLKVDVTDYNASLGELQREWQVFGPPALLFFDAQGKPVPGLRMVGDVNTACFMTHVQALNSHKTTANCAE
jgi:thiol:disulfide interchange protein DsbD